MLAPAPAPARTGATSLSVTRARSDGRARLLAFAASRRAASVGNGLLVPYLTPCYGVVISLLALNPRVRYRRVQLEP